ncbi:MAG: hypothetical protein HZA16_15175 [Nitrospirae bacterium]|nr:hypothetical protein [Nitrospirota bacterium]
MKTEDAAAVRVFDGTSLKEIPPPAGKLTEAHGITPGLYGALFFSKKGFYPETVIFRVDDKLAEVDKVFLQPLKDAGMGVLTGVVFKPVTGGKLREHNGIFHTYKGEKIVLIKDDIPLTIATDDAGTFSVELSPGDYDVVFNNENAGRAHITRGETTIINIQKGMVLKD